MYLTIYYDNCPLRQRVIALPSFLLYKQLNVMGEHTLLIRLGKKIKAIRMQKSMTQNELAMECDFEKASLSRIESGQSNPTIRTLFKISKALEVPIADFFKE
jgi:DNA-binding XRE family transcriptional regulator